MKHDQYRERDVKLRVLRLVMAKVHSQQAAQTSSQRRDAQERLFRDPPLMAPRDVYKRQEFNLRLIDGNGNRISGASYYVEDTDVCSVSGVTVCGEGKGTTEVTVKYNGKSYTCIVRVG